MSDDNKPLCWGEIAMLREVNEQNAELTDRLHDAIGLLTEIVQALSGALQDVQVERLMPYLERRLAAIEQQQKRRAA